MWERKELKQRAKQVLRSSYWKAFLVCIVLTIAGGGMGMPGLDTNLNLGPSSSPQAPGSMDGSWEFSGVSTAIVVAAVLVFLFVLLLIFAFRIFIGFPLETGSMRYFKEAAERNADLNQLGYAFKAGRYMDIIKAMLWKAFLNFLWYLLLFIPGIVKSYAYSMVPFILADNPNIGWWRAVELSNEMTKGHKFRMFVLDLSFLGWILLGTLLFFVGVLFVQPYIYATKAELYLSLRAEAINKGLSNEHELKLNPTPFI